MLVAIVAVWPHPETFFDFFFTLVLIWAGVDLGAMHGETGANRYGRQSIGTGGRDLKARAPGPSGFAEDVVGRTSFSFSSITARCCLGLLIGCPNPS